MTRRSKDDSGPITPRSINSSLSVNTPSLSGAAPTTRSRRSVVTGRRSQISTDLITGTPVFLGPTSFSAVFMENRENLEPLPTPEQSISGSVADGANRSRDAGPYVETVGGSLIQLGATVLDQIPNKDMCKALFQTSHHPHDGFKRLAGLETSDEIWEVWREESNLSLGHKHIELSKDCFCPT